MFWKNKKLKINEEKIINHNDYIDYRNYLIKQKHSVSDKESKLLIYLSAGVLSFSVAFIEKNDFNEYFCFIIISWILAVSSFILLLFSFDYSKRGFEKQIEIIDIEYKNEQIKEKNKNIKDRDKKKIEKNVPDNIFIENVKKSTFYARIFLIFSIIILFVFYSINLIKNV